MRKQVKVTVSVDTLESLLTTLSRRWNAWHGPNPADPVLMNPAEAELLRASLLDMAAEATAQAEAIAAEVKRVDGTIPEPDSRPRFYEPGRIPS